jgi:1-acyl-sn-glycerol-3-phosphate acyltransferase
MPTGARFSFRLAPLWCTISFVHTMVSHVAYDIMLLVWRIATNIFFREIRPRGSYNVPREGAVLVVGAPHHNQAGESVLVNRHTLTE